MSVLLIGTETVRERPVTLSLDGLLHHTLIVGQSGSGKSYFVARLVEEILTRTGARVVALDPNGDLRNLDVASMDGLAGVRSAMDELAKRAGLEAMDSKDAFAERWSTRRMVFLNSAERRPERPLSLRIDRRRLVVDWASMEDEQDALLQLDSHNRPTQLLGIKACRELVDYAQGANSPLRLEQNLRGLAEASDLFAGQNVNMRPYGYAKHLTVNDWSNVRARFLDLLSRHQIWSPENDRRSAPYTLAEIVDAPFDSDGRVADWNALIIGLDAARQPDALLSASVTLARLWRNAKFAAREQARRPSGEDPRVPTFIVVDEAHNFVPAATEDSLRRRVSEKIIQIASEGRKYGLYLILATQRPTKLHPELVPECENACVLRVQSERELSFAAETLGIPQDRVANAVRFAQGQGLLSGRWVDGGVLDVKAAPARTLVGGGGLSVDWIQGPRTVALEDEPYGPKRLVEARDAVLAILRENSAPIALNVLAERVKSHLDLGSAPEWFAYSSFKKMLVSLGIEGLEIANVGPGYAYLHGVHQPPVVDETSSLAGSQGLPEFAPLLHAECDIPLLSSEEYAILFTVISEELAVNPYSLTSTSKAVRDLMYERGHPVGRSAVNYVLKGVAMGDHDFSADRSQEPDIIADSFIRGLAKFSNRVREAKPEERQGLQTWIAGALSSAPYAASDSLEERAEAQSLEGVECNADPGQGHDRIEVEEKPVDL
jgi:hypothetical protein